MNFLIRIVFLLTLKEYKTGVGGLYTLLSVLTTEKIIKVFSKRLKLHLLNLTPVFKLLSF